ncbi:MAG: hypothetical protein ACLQBX_18575 [Candidatus Limnocylindrales bacterium]
MAEPAIAEVVAARSLAEGPHHPTAPRTADATAGGGATVMAIRVCRPTSGDGLAVPPESSNTPPMDPLVVALAQLVRDRWAAEQRERAAQRARLAVVEGKR